MAVPTAEGNVLATKYGTDCPWIALCSAAPTAGAALTNEITGGSPAYARVAAGWSVAAGKVITCAGSINVPASQAVTHLALVTAASGAATCIDFTAVAWSTNGVQSVASVSATFTLT